jgi:hypothetical protein
MNRTKLLRHLLFLFFPLLCPCGYAAGQADAAPVAEGSSDLAKQTLGRACEQRLSVHQLEVQWVVKTIAEETYPELVGRTCEYHGWYDYKENRIRVEMDRVSPRDPSMTGRSRFAYSGGRYLIVDSENLIGHELNEYDPEYMHDKGSLSVFHLSTDPRLMGMYPVEFVLLKNYTLNAVLELLYSAQEVAGSVLTGAEPSRNSVTLRRCKDLAHDVTFEFQSRGPPLPVRITSVAVNGAETLGISVECEWMRVEDSGSPGSESWMPASVASRRTVNGRMIVDERCDISAARIGERPRDELFTWQTMRLPHGFVVKEQSQQITRMKQWNVATEAFGPWVPHLLDTGAVVENTVTSKTEITDRRSRRLWLIAVSLLLGICCFASALFYRRRRGD